MFPIPAFLSPACWTRLPGLLLALLSPLVFSATLLHAATASPGAGPAPIAVQAPTRAREAEPDAGLLVANVSPIQVPVYRTRMPPAVTLDYTLRKGGWTGTGELHWRPDGNRYEARLEGRVAGFKVLTWASEGSFDRAGVAPLRFTDERRGKAMLAANFQRQNNRITFSDPSTEYPLVPGAQDRLSWMVQLAAIASAEPRRVAPGQRVSLFVAGARGDADVWSFQAQTLEDIAAAGATVHAIRLLREPRKPNDTRVEVWLDPGQHYLPIRARLTSDGDTLELLLRGMHPPA